MSKKQGKRNTQLGPWTLVSCLGRNCYQWLYLARHKSTHMEALLKVLTAQYSALPEIRSRFLLEAHIASSFSNLFLPVQRIFEQDGCIVAVSDRPCGRILSKIPGLRSPTETIELCLDVAHSLYILHSNASTHAAIRANAIEVLADTTTQRFRARLMDAGLCIPIGHDASAFAGVDDYLAPESAAGAAMTTSADVYGLGALAWRLLSGHRYQSGPDATLPPATPTSISAPIRRCLATDPSARPQDMLEVADLLRRTYLDLECKPPTQAVHLEQRAMASTAPTAPANATSNLEDFEGWFAEDSTLSEQQVTDLYGYRDGLRLMGVSPYWLAASAASFLAVAMGMTVCNG